MTAESKKKKKERSYKCVCSLLLSTWKAEGQERCGSDGPSRSSFNLPDVYYVRTVMCRCKPAVRRTGSASGLKKNIKKQRGRR